MTDTIEHLLYGEQHGYMRREWELGDIIVVNGHPFYVKGEDEHGNILLLDETPTAEEVERRRAIHQHRLRSVR